jgi:uncharacterized protein (TIGR02001 family)
VRLRSGLFLSMLAVVLPAEAARAGNTFSGSLALVSDYRFRGISQNNREAAPQVEIDWRNENGWSGGLWASTVDFDDRENTSFEIDLYGARAFTLWNGDLSLQVYYYAYPDHHPKSGSPRYSAFEASAEFSHSLGPVEVKAAAAWSPEFFGETGRAVSLSLNASYPLTENVSLSGTFGQQWVAAWDRAPGAGFPYRYWDIGVSRAFRHFTMDLRATGTSLNAGQCALTQGRATWCETGLIATLAYGFGGGERAN